jgi:hypothetical protein
MRLSFSRRAWRIWRTVLFSGSASGSSPSNATTVSSASSLNVGIGIIILAALLFRLIARFQLFG